MHLNPKDIENVAKLNIGQKLERRRRSVQLVLVRPEEDTNNDRLKLPPAPRRLSLGGKSRGGPLRLTMPERPCPPPFALFPSSAPFLPLIEPKSSPRANLSMPSPLGGAAAADDDDDTGDGLRLLRRRSAFSFVSPQLPPLFLSKATTDGKRHTKEATDNEKEANGAGDEDFSAVTSVISSSNSRGLVSQSPLIKLNADAPPQLISQQRPTAEKISDEEEDTVENSLLAFVRAQQKIAQHRAQLDYKLDVVSCHRMAVKMIDELLGRLDLKCHSPPSAEGKGPTKHSKSQLTIAEVQKDFFPFIYARAEQMFVDRRMANSYTRKLSDKK